MPMQAGIAAYVTIRHLFISLMFSSSECPLPAQERLSEKTVSVCARCRLNTYVYLSVRPDKGAFHSLACCCISIFGGEALIDLPTASSMA